MNDLEKKSIECIKNMPIEETTYQVARNVVLDYITNLQQENEKLKEDLIGQENLAMAFSKTSHDYYQRIEKAVEYIKKQYKWIEESDKRWQPVLDNKKILNILNGKE